jgi:hypothetical protein
MIAEGFTPETDLMAGGDAKAMKLAFTQGLNG